MKQITYFATIAMIAVAFGAIGAGNGFADDKGNGFYGDGVGNGFSAGKGNGYAHEDEGLDLLKDRNRGGVRGLKDRNNG